MSEPDVFLSDLEKLPPRAIAAFAARCARRVLPLLGHAPLAAQAIGAIELFASGEPKQPVGQFQSKEGWSHDFAFGAGNVITGAVYSYAAAAGDDVRMAANLASQAATESVEVISRVYDDRQPPTGFANIREYCNVKMSVEIRTLFVILEKLGYSSFKVDTSERGPLGRLWPHDDPIALTASHRLNVNQSVKVSIESPVNLTASVSKPIVSTDPPLESEAIELYIDPGEASLDDVQAILRALNESHRTAGGLGLEFQIDGTFVIARKEVPA